MAIAPPSLTLPIEGGGKRTAKRFEGGGESASGIAVGRKAASWRPFCWDGCKPIARPLIPSLSRDETPASRAPQDEEKRAKGIAV